MILSGFQTTALDYIWMKPISSLDLKMLNNPDKNQAEIEYLLDAVMVAWERHE